MIFQCRALCAWRNHEGYCKMLAKAWNTLFMLCFVLLSLESQGQCAFIFEWTEGFMPFLCYREQRGFTVRRGRKCERNRIISGLLCIGGSAESAALEAGRLPALRLSTLTGGSLDRILCHIFRMQGLQSINSACSLLIPCSPWYF